jgi:hypothetical protein
MNEDDPSVRQGAAIGLAAPQAQNLDRIIELISQISLVVAKRTTSEVLGSKNRSLFLPPVRNLFDFKTPVTLQPPDLAAETFLVIL